MKKFATLTLVLLFLSCGKNEEVKPLRQDIQELVFASGQLEWDDSYNVIAQTDGVLGKVVFEVGQPVTKGMIIASIDNKVNEVNAESAQEQLVISNQNVTANAPALLQLEQNIQFAQSKYQQDKKQAERYERLQQNNIGSKVEYENAQLAAKNSLANLKALQKQYDVLKQQAQQQLIASRAQLKSNKVLQGYNSVVVAESGTVVKKFKNQGDYVKKGDIIATIGNQQKVEAVLNVDENSIGKIKLGQTVYVKLNTEKSKVYNGKVTEILSAFDVQSQSFICKVTFNEPLAQSLFGTQLEANILVAEKKNALLIPRNYMGFGNKVNVKGKEENVILKTGIISTDYVEVLDGLSETDVLLPLKP
ncbi:efflux RND transporter periplasmic adaptor subunit [Flavobacterium cheonhonense]|uniref:Efflux RND transporter periplasmic adaptor subunit n=1 Tax=Flavobacterium cheonhonense TaxID=706185 RepID=A0ABP7T6Y8_9FLAO|nr:HlyD family efflux transporter periplasmic adaptor subunit [Flavobacterium cheonhonense]